MQLTILIKQKYADLHNINSYYVDELHNRDVTADISYLALPMKNGKAPTNQELKDFLVNYKVRLQQSNYLLVTESSLFKLLTGKRQAEVYTGYVLPCTLKEFENVHILYVPNYMSIVYNPVNANRLALALDGLVDHMNGLKNKFDSNPITELTVLEEPDEIRDALVDLLKHPKLAIDIEAYGLKLSEAHIATIAFCWDLGKCLVIKCDYGLPRDDKHYCSYEANPVVRELLRKFFTAYKGKKLFHNAPYDVKHIIYNCFMKETNDHELLLTGLETMTKNLEDTKVISYLALNSIARNSYTLKDLAHEYVGNYAVDVKDIRTVETDVLCNYNAIDVSATLYLYNKYYPAMVRDNQEPIYKELMLPSLKSIIHMEMIGFPVDMQKAVEVNNELTAKLNQLQDEIYSSKYVAIAEEQLAIKELAKINSKLKTIQKDLSDLEDFKFNLNSTDHLAELLFTVIGLPVLDYTPSKKPVVDARTLQKLLNHTEDEEVLELINKISQCNQLSKVLGTFIPALLNSECSDGYHYLRGSFNLGTVVSGRLSSSNP